MKLSLNWIKDFLSLPSLDPQEVMNRVTMATAEVEGVERVGAHFGEVVTARVTAVNPHPGSDHLKLVRVFYGLGEIEVVCGAPNVETGQIVPLARSGCELPKGKLASAVIRGVRSEGMICAEDELGLSDDHAGVLVFPEGTEAGVPLDRLFGPPDIVFEIENKSLTHRPDLWGHYGFAREFSAIYGPYLRPYQPPSFDTSTAGSDPLRVENKVPGLCPRYSALVVSNVRVRPSPLWMQQRLRAVGLRPINNLVDVTNYVMLETGQPMHAFDRREIEGDLIQVRRAEEGETFVTLDEKTHLLAAQDILIGDGRRAVALGGVMGGINSGVREDTTGLVLESACFHPAHIRRTATRLNLRTDSAMRFEKGQDPANTLPAIWRALELLRLTCPEAAPAAPLLDDWPVPPRQIEIPIEYDFIHDRLGERLTEEAISLILSRLGFGLKPVGGGMIVSVPSWRATRDVSQKADLVEEIGRVFGYDNITPMAPLVRSDPPPRNEMRRMEWRLRDLLTGFLGFDEVANYSFTSGERLVRFGFEPESALRILNPIASDADRMRVSLIPQITENAALNQRTFDAFRIFEIGRSTHKAGEGTKELSSERRILAGALFGEPEPVFLHAKGALADLFARLRIPSVDWRPEGVPPAWAHPGRWVRVFTGDSELGLAAELHPRLSERYELRGRLGLFEVDLEVLLSRLGGGTDYKPLRRFPTSPIEITAVLPLRRPVAELEKVILQTTADFLVEMRYLYSYEGEPLQAGQRAVTYRLVLGVEDRTLGPEELNEIHRRLREALRAAGLPLRGDETP